MCSPQNARLDRILAVLKKLFESPKNVFNKKRHSMKVSQNNRFVYIKLSGEAGVVTVAFNPST